MDAQDFGAKLCFMSAVKEDEMKRDDDLIRRILLDMEADPEAIRSFAGPNAEDKEDLRVYNHLQLMADAGLVEEVGRGSGWFRMRNQGHDYLATIRDDAAWRQVKNAVSGFQGVTLGLMRDIALAYLKETVRGMGIKID